ncbi:MAG: serine hydrolase domain-containing protein [Chloroflexota bacterium]
MSQTNKPFSDHDLERFARECLEDNGIPGASIAVFVDGEPALITAFGSTDLPGTKPLTTDARFYTYSITKTFIAIAMMQLVEEGRLDLDDPVRRYLPELPIPEPITVRQLLNHTAGLPDYGALPEYKRAVRETPDTPWTPDEFLERTMAQGMLFQPGEGWSYSNIGYLILKLLLEELHRSSLKCVLEERLFARLELTQTFVAEDLSDASVLAPGYTTFFDPDGEPRDMTAIYHPGWVSHGVAISTAADTARILDALLAGKLVSESSLEEMLVPIPVEHDHPLFEKPSYGLGLMLDPASQFGLIAGHAGAGPGYSTAAFHFPDVDGSPRTVTVLTSTDTTNVALEVAFMVTPEPRR